MEEGKRKSLTVAGSQAVRNSERRLFTMRKQYSMKTWKKVVIGLMFLLTIANGIWICLREDNVPRWKVAVEIPMANAGVEWTGAGYNGIWGK